MMDPNLNILKVESQFRQKVLAFIGGKWCRRHHRRTLVPDAVGPKGERIELCRACAAKGMATFQEVT